MKNYIYIFFVSIVFLSSSQESINIEPYVVTGCGGSLQGYSMVSLKSDFTLGDIAIETISSENFMLTQGFHQPSLGIIGLNESTHSKISIYPNPTVDILNLELIEFESAYVQVQILDLSGKIIYSCMVSTNDQKHQINTSILSLGSYVLEVIGKEQKDVFKIQKLK